MGKKSKSKPSEVDLPQWHEALDRATSTNVAALPLVDHGWICTLIHADTRKHKHGILAILDITNRVRGEGMEQRFQNIGPCPNPRKNGGKRDIVKALLATMIQPQPTPRGDSKEYFAPRRPAWVLLEKELEPCLGVVREALAEVEVAVKLNTPEALAEDTNDVAEDNSGRTATWEAGLEIGATVENVKKLPQRKGNSNEEVSDDGKGKDEKDDEVWKVSMVMLADESNGAKECFLAIENITDGTDGTDEESSYPLGVGPTPAPTLNPDGMVRSIFATMLAPRAREGGYSGDGRRPYRIIIDKPLEPWLEHLQNKLGEVDVAVELQ